jgi:hypothetical protein
MAAPRSIRRNDKTVATPSASSHAAEGGQEDAVREALVHAAQIQLASITAVSRFVAGWAEAAHRCARTLSDELLNGLQGETARGELIGRLAPVSRLHLRELTALPNAAVSHFNSELAKPANAPHRPRHGKRGVNGGTSRPGTRGMATRAECREAA